MTELSLISLQHVKGPVAAAKVFQSFTDDWGPFDDCPVGYIASKVFDGGRTVAVIVGVPLEGTKQAAYGMPVRVVCFSDHDDGPRAFIGDLAVDAATALYETKAPYCDVIGDYRAPSFNEMPAFNRVLLYLSQPQPFAPTPHVGRVLAKMHAWALQTVRDASSLALATACGGAQ